MDKSAWRGEPSHVWRAGQSRRLDMICRAAPQQIQGRVLVDGCGEGMYLEKLAAFAACAVGLDIELERALIAHLRAQDVLTAAAETLPLASASFDLVLSHEVLEHVRDDAQAIREIVRVLRPGGRLVLFCPNRGYPFETHGIFWRGKYHFGNIPLVNYLPDSLRNRLAPHVRAYRGRELEKLFDGLPCEILERTIIFGAYDNLIRRWGFFGRFLRVVMQALEATPLRALGLSHFWVVEKI